jgi:hypothetical protein
MIPKYRRWVGRGMKLRVSGWWIVDSGQWTVDSEKSILKDGDRSSYSHL